MIVGERKGKDFAWLKRSVDLARFRTDARNAQNRHFGIVYDGRKSCSANAAQIRNREDDTGNRGWNFDGGFLGFEFQERLVLRNRIAGGDEDSGRLARIHVLAELGQFDGSGHGWRPLRDRRSKKSSD